MCKLIEFDFGYKKLGPPFLKHLFSTFTNLKLTRRTWGGSEGMGKREAAALSKVALRALSRLAASPTPPFPLPTHRPPPAELFTWPLHNVYVLFSSIFLYQSYKLYATLNENQKKSYSSFYCCSALLRQCWLKLNGEREGERERKNKKNKKENLLFICRVGHIFHDFPFAASYFHVHFPVCIMLFPSVCFALCFAFCC